MVRPIVKDPIFLARKSAPATAEDLGTARDLMDTLLAHKSECVGMAANMIGAARRIIVFDNAGEYMTMFNPEIVQRTGDYEAEEGCLSLPGVRKTIRYRTVTVRYETAAFETRLRVFTGIPAQIIQHEIDHCDGILI